MKLAVHHYNLFLTCIWRAERHDMAALFPAWPNIEPPGNDQSRVAIPFDTVFSALAK